jgi:TorA maturation chaperone TorD
MSIDPETGADDAIDLAREGLYRFLAAALDDPAGAAGSLLRDPAARRAAAVAAELLRDSAEGLAAPLGFGEAPAEALDLTAALEQFHRHGDDLDQEYQRVFGLLAPRECPPYETEYHVPQEAFYQAQQLADVAGFYRAFGLEPARDAPKRPDYLPLEMEFLALLLLKKRLAGGATSQDQGEVCARAEEAFFRDHLAWWLPAFTVGLRRQAGGGFYAAVGEVLAAFLRLERARFGLPAPRAPLALATAEPAGEPAECAACSV